MIIIFIFYKNSSIDNFHQHYHKIHSYGKKLLKLQYCDIKIPLKLRAELQILIKNILIDLKVNFYLIFYLKKKKNNLNSTEEELKIPNLEQIGYFMCETFQIMKKLILTLLKIREIQLCLPVIPKYLYFISLFYLKKKKVMMNGNY